MRETEAHARIVPDATVRERAAAWLGFAVYHGAGKDGAGRGGNAKPHKGGPTLAAEATLRGSLAVLVGPSGAGKTSLLRSIAGLMQPQRGYVTVAGTSVWDSKRGVRFHPARRGCGLVTQRHALFPAMTAADNIAFGLHTMPREERERRVQEMAALFRLEAVLSRRPAQLSGGEQQIGRAHV